LQFQEALITPANLANCFKITGYLMGIAEDRMETVNIPLLHIAQVVSIFMSAASPLNLVATFRNGGINLAIADEQLICWITHGGARCLMASVAFEGNPRDEAVSDGELTETQLYLE
jgi:hypothetical protein